MRDGMSFYRSFYEAISCEENPENRLKAYEAIFRYAFYDETPQGLTGVGLAAFIVAKPVIDKSNKDSDNGKKGGRPPKAQVIESDKKKEGLNPAFVNAKSNEHEHDNEHEHINEKTSSNFITKNKKNKFQNFEERVIDFENLERGVK